MTLSLPPISSPSNVACRSAIDALPRVLRSDYIPTDIDLLRLHYRTAGIVPHRIPNSPSFVPHVLGGGGGGGSLVRMATGTSSAGFGAGGGNGGGGSGLASSHGGVRLIDVGGARHERLKWGAQFEAARSAGSFGGGGGGVGEGDCDASGDGALTAVIFVVALDSCFQELDEDERAESLLQQSVSSASAARVPTAASSPHDASLALNRMHDALELFRLVCAEPALRDVPRLLVLNKFDAFEIALAKEPAQFRRAFPAFRSHGDGRGGSGGARAAAEFVRSAFVSICPSVDSWSAIDSCVRNDYQRRCARAQTIRFQSCCGGLASSSRVCTFQYSRATAVHFRSTRCAQCLTSSATTSSERAQRTNVENVNIQTCTCHKSCKSSTTTALPAHHRDFPSILFCI